MKKKFFLILFCLFGFLFSEAQIFEPVHWNISHKLTGKTTADIIFKASIDDGWHLYGLSLPPNGPKPTSIVFEKIEHAQKVGNLQAASKLEKKFDSNFGMELSWYSKEAVFVQKISFSSIQNVRLEGYIEYMACNDKSCLPPTTEPFSIQLNSKEISSVVVDKNTTLSSSEKIQPTEDFKNANQVDLSSEDNAEISASQWWTPVIKELNNFGNVAADKETASLWYVLLAGLLGGFLALLTPCVWPIIPMTVSFFLKRSAVPSRGRKDAVLYGLSIIVIYVVLGLLITLIFGASALNSMSTNALFNLFFFILLVVFALSFFGAFELTLPSSWSTKVDAKAESTVGLLSILLMAFTLVLVSFSCTGPIIGTLLVEVAASGSLLAPAIGMFGFSFALAVPFTLFAFFPSWLESLPRSGGWLNRVKVVLAFIELAFALKFLSVADLAYGWHILDREVFVSLWIVIFTLLGIYLLGKIRFPHDSESKHTSVGGLMLGIVSLAFAVYMVPGLWGAPLKSISAFAPPLYTQDFNLYKDEVHPDFTDFEEGMTYAAMKKMPVVIDFSGYGCVNCRKMEASVWTDPQVKELLDKNFVLISLFVDDKTPLDQPFEINENGKTRKIKTIGDKWSYLQRYKFGANAQPFYVMIDYRGKPLNKPYVFDTNASHFVNWLNRK